MSSYSSRSIFADTICRYIVEKIVGHLVDEDVSSLFVNILRALLTSAQTGTLLFQVIWEGYDKASDRTWEPEENLL